MKKFPITTWAIIAILGAALATFGGDFLNLLNDTVIQLGLCKNADAACILRYKTYFFLALILLTLSMDLVIKSDLTAKLISWRNVPKPKNIRLSYEVPSENEVLLRICNREWRKPFMEYFSEVTYDGGLPDKPPPDNPKYYHRYGAGGGIYPKPCKLEWSLLRKLDNPNKEDYLLPKNMCATVNFIDIDLEVNAFRIDADHIRDIRFPPGIYQFTVKVTGIANGVENKKPIKIVLHREIKVSVTYKETNQIDIHIS